MLSAYFKIAKRNTVYIAHDACNRTGASILPSPVKRVTNVMTHFIPRDFVYDKILPYCTVSAYVNYSDTVEVHDNKFLGVYSYNRNNRTKNVFIGNRVKFDEHRYFGSNAHRKYILCSISPISN